MSILMQKYRQKNVPTKFMTVLALRNAYAGECNYASISRTQVS
jgi:hypothetical protein